MTDHAKSHKRSWREDERIFHRDVKPAIGHIKARELRRTDVLAMLNAIRDRGSPIMANRTLAALRRAYSWAIGESLVEHNPCTGISNRGAETVRTRVLSTDEARMFWEGLNEARMADHIKLALRIALVTGQRIGEVLSMDRSDIDHDKATWNIPAEKSKNGMAHSVPLSSLAISLVEQAEIREGTFLFQSRPRKPFDGEKALDASSVAHALRRCLPSMGFADNPFRVHDLRRTAATGLAELGIAESTIARVLNHKSEIGKTITGRVYIQHGYEAEKRRALDAWSAELQRIVAREDLERNVINLK